MPRKRKTKGKAKPVNQKKARKAGKRFSDKKKQALLDRYNALRKEGKNTADAAKAVGVPYITLHTWEKKVGGGKRVAPKAGKAHKQAAHKALKKAVKIPRGRKTVAKKTSAAGAGKLVLVTPAGFRIEGISSGELIKVLKSLK